MRYPDGGGLSPAARGRRETVRLQAAQMFAADVPPVQVATRLRVSMKSVYQWRRRWRAGGEAALTSTGPGGARCRLSDAQLDRLRIELERGPAAHGWGDQRWTLARIATLIARLFHLRYTPRGTAYLLHRMGWSAQLPRHRAGRARRGRDRRVAHPDLGEGTRLAAATGAWIVIWGRGRRHPAPAEGAHLGRPRAHPGGRGVGPGRAGVDGRAGLLPARLAGPAVLPGPGAPPPPRGAAQLLRERLRRADRRRARPAARPDHPDLGQPQRQGHCIVRNGC